MTCTPIDYLLWCNSILWGNQDGGASVEDAQIFIASSLSPDHVIWNCIQDADPNDAIQYDGIGNIDDDPLFADPANDVYDLGLSPASPCIDAGNDNLLPDDEFDIDEDGFMGEQLPLDVIVRDRINDTRLQWQRG